MIRVRFAPSPTGLLHIGNARTALFNWLFARHTGGSFVLRIEDTDVARSDPRYTQQIIEDLRWLGLDWQEGPDIGGAYGPYLQSQRLGLYQEFSKKLLASGKAYPCYCTPGELESRRQASRAKGKPPRYDNRCCNLSEKEKRAFEAEGRRPSLRFMVPDKKIVFEDLIRGKCEFNMALFGDFILMKADGTPSFHLAVVVDDSLMKITHVIRGEDHLTNTPLHLLLFEALGYEPPRFAHPPLITGEEGLLSKRHGALSIRDYRERGYLPEALVNYMLLLGWSPREKREKFSLKEAIERFELNHVSRSPATFDEKKLDWLAGQYLRQADIDRLTELAIPYFQGLGLVPRDRAKVDYPRLKAIVEAVRPGLHCLSELAKEADFFFKGLVLGEEERNILSSDKTQRVLSMTLEVLEDYPAQADLKDFTSVLVGQRAIEAKEWMMTLRLALTGRAHGPELNAILSILGREECKRRLQDALMIKSKVNHK